MQFLDILENKDNIHIEIDDKNKILYDIIKECNLDVKKLIKYAKETNNKKVLDKILILEKYKNIYRSIALLINLWYNSHKSS